MVVWGQRVTGIGFIHGLIDLEREQSVRGKSYGALDKLRDCIWDMDMKQLFNIQFQCQSQAAGCKRVGCQALKAETFQPTTQ